METNIQLFTVPIINRHLYMDLLLLADESKEIISGYINKGDMYAISDKDEVIGVVLFIFHADQIVELKNIALHANVRGEGLGKKIIAEAIQLYRLKNYKKMIVGTANSSIANIAFYQKAGFRLTEIKKGFFDKYPVAIYEDGIRAQDMIMFEKYLD